MHFQVDHTFVDNLETAKELMQGPEGSVVTIEAVKPGEAVKPFQVNIEFRVQN